MPRKKPQYKQEARSQAEQLLRGLPGSLDAIAQAIGVSKTLVHEWRTGAKKPARKNRELVTRAFQHIAPDAWDETPKAQPAPESQEVGELTNLESANRLLREIRAAASSSEITATTREKLASREIAVLKFREDLLRREQLMENEIVQKHPEWVKIKERLSTAIAACCPDCASKLMGAIRGEA